MPPVSERTSSHERGLNRRWRRFRRARHAVWLALPASSLTFVAIHDWMAQSNLVRLGWLLCVIGAIGVPLGVLFGFRCPRCGETYLATGRARDFLGLGRILWSNRCGSCSLRAGHIDDLRHVPDSGPIG